MIYIICIHSACLCLEKWDFLEGKNAASIGQFCEITGLLTFSDLVLNPAIHGSASTKASAKVEKFYISLEMCGLQ